MKKLYRKVQKMASTENLKFLEYHTYSKKHQFFLLFAVNGKMKMKKYLKKRNELRY